MGEATYIDQRTTDRLLFSRSVLGLIIIIILVTIIAYSPATAALWGYWIDEPSLGGHGLLVAVLAAWLLYRSRARLNAGASPAPRLASTALLVLCSIACVILWRAGIQSLQLLFLPVLMLLAVWAAFGIGVLRVAAVPIGYLLFAMPAWNLLAVPAQRLTLEVVGLVSPLLGLPAAVSGTLVSFPDGSQFEVTLACSGVGFLVQGLAVAVLLGELEQAAVRRRFNLLVSVALIALATNWIRVLALLWLGYSSGMRNVLATRDHLQFGYVLFVIAIVLYVWIVTRHVPNQARPPSQTERSDAVMHGAGYFRALAALVIVPIAVGIAGLMQGGVTRSVAQVLPLAPEQWAGPLPNSDQAWQPTFVGAQTTRHVVYLDGARRSVELLIVGYPNQEQGRELVNEENSLVGNGGLTSVASSLVSDAGTSYRETVAIDPLGNRSIIWSYYEIGGRRFVTPILSQLWYGLRSLTSPPYSSLLALRALCSESCDVARATLAQFARETDMHSGAQS
jgi:EpsI family protein